MPQWGINENSDYKMSEKRSASDEKNGSLANFSLLIQNQILGPEMCFYQPCKFYSEHQELKIAFICCHEEMHSIPVPTLSH